MTAPPESSFLTTEKAAGPLWWAAHKRPDVASKATECPRACEKNVAGYDAKHPGDACLPVGSRQATL